MPKRICFIATTAFTVRVFLYQHILALSKAFEVTVITTQDNDLEATLKDIGVSFIPINITRQISVWSDFANLLRLINILKRNNFNSIHSVTPKAGLLSMLAGKLTNVKTRVHIFTGQVWVTKKGFFRYLLMYIDKWIGSLATHILVDSASQLHFLRKHNVLADNQGLILAKGSICGVDLARFKVNAQSRLDLRSKYALESNAIVFLYLGRLNLDKGVVDLAQAFTEFYNNLKQKDSQKNCYLIFVGPDEQGLTSKIMKICASCIHFVKFENYTEKPENYMSMADILCIPSCREGFGNVVIEAAAAGIPSIGTRIYGLTDAIIEGHTGLLSEVHDIGQLKTNIQSLYFNDELRLRLGSNAYIRATEQFDRKLVTKAWLEFYDKNV